MKYEKYINKNIDSKNFEGKNIFITGGNSGIGFELAKQCAFLGANIFLLCRNKERAEVAKEELLSNFPKAKVNIILLDLADFSSIRNAVENIKNYDVDVFVNNAGVYRLPKSNTKDGLEIIMGTNFFGTLYLNDLLQTHLISLNHSVKIVFESSVTSKLSKININDFFMDENYKSLSVYGRSKTGVNSIYFDCIKNNCYNLNIALAHPGVAYTPLIKKGYRNKIFEKIASLFMKIVFHSPEKASLSLLKAIDDQSKSCSYGPRGLLGFTGYPHHWHIKESKNSKETIEFARNKINEIVS